jgi:hypothetical protein
MAIIQGTRLTVQYILNLLAHLCLKSQEPVLDRVSTTCGRGWVNHQTSKTISSIACSSSRSPAGTASVTWTFEALRSISIKDYEHSNIKTKIFLHHLSNSGLAVRHYSEGGQLARLKPFYRRQHAAISSFWLPPRQL